MMVQQAVCMSAANAQWLCSARDAARRDVPCSPYMHAGASSR
jgi:hypothetical protein